MTKLRLYAHLIVPIKDKVESVHFKAINVCESTAQYLKRIYGAKIHSSALDQNEEELIYADTIYLENVSDACIEGILRDFPFIRKSN